MPRICFYSVATHLGGAERSLLEYLKFAKTQKDVDIEVLLPKEDGPLVDALRRENIHHKVLNMPPVLLGVSRQKKIWNLLYWQNFQYFFSLISHLKKNQPHILYTTGIKCHLLGGLASLFSGTPIVWHLRDHLSGPMGVLFRLMYLMPHIRAVANSSATAKSLSKKLPPFVVHNGINPEEFFFQRSDILRKELLLADETRIVGIVGVLAQWKGQTEFIKMADLLLKKHKSLHFVIIGEQIYDTEGDQGYKQKLLSLSEKLGIQEHLSFLGYRKDPAPILQSLDVLVHASLKPEPSAE